MNTDKLIDLLANGAGPVMTTAVSRRLLSVVAGGALASALAALALLGWLGPDQWAASSTLAKLAYAGGLALSLSWLTGRLARPGAPVGWPLVALLGVFALMAAAGAAVLARTPPDLLRLAIVGQSALVCPWAILLLSLPALSGLMWMLRQMAPTRLALTGLAAGLLAGAVGAAGYALTCTEGSLAFVALWYSLGILLAGFAGALLGPRLLRW